MVDPDAHRGQLVDLCAADEGSPAPGDGTQFSDRFPIARDDEGFPCRHGLDHFRVVIPQFALRDCPCHRPSVAVIATVRYRASTVPLLREWLPRLREVSVGSKHEWIDSGLSDHVPVVVDLADTEPTQTRAE